MINLEKLLDRLPREAADAIVGQARLSSRTLSAHLRERLGQHPGMPGSIVAEPVLEGAFPWLQLDGGWDGLPNNLFHADSLAVLRQVSPDPYVHQVEAWRHLTADPPRSVIVSSGTGSGKTECFLAPMLDRLVRNQAGRHAPSVGVRAIMLYPLNALINSQEERLAKWFAPFGGKLRYCLYNGATPEEAPNSKKQEHPWRVIDRQTLRSSPPPVLVTNVTMLEYMLIRQKDAPILRASQGMLDFIVLDEAHTYVGAQAAELALLLRRVALAFGRNPQDIRYVATSATIGADADDQLRAFLRDISGAPADHVHLVKGKHAPLPPAQDLDEMPLDIDRLSAMTQESAGEVLSRSRPLRLLREKLHSGAFVRWSEWRQVVGRLLHADETVSDELAAACLRCVASAKDPCAPPRLAAIGADHLLPLRVHLFHGTIAGVWSCIDSRCPKRPESAESDWPFGAIFLEPREKCPHCAALVFEVGICGECGGAALRAEECDDGQRLATWVRTTDDDDFAQTLDSDDPDGDEESHDEPALPVVPRFFFTKGAGGRTLHVNPETGHIHSRPEAGALSLRATSDITTCVCCGSTPKRFNPDDGAMRPLRVGAPYLMGQTAPAVVDVLTPDPGDSTDPRPSDGKRLLSFTDARQGTARHAASLQVGSERGYVRSFVYHFVQDRDFDEARVNRLRREIAALEVNPNPALADLTASKKRELLTVLGDAPKPWKTMVSRFAGTPTVEYFLSDIWGHRDPRFSDVEELAEFLLYREMMRRPARANSPETLGLVRYLLPGIDGADVHLPESARNLGLSESDWKDALRIIVTYFLRENLSIDVRREWMHWIDRRQSRPGVVPWTPNVQAGPTRFWLNPYTSKGKAVTLISQGCNLRLGRKGDDDVLHQLLRDAYHALKRYLTAVGDTNAGERLRLGELAVGPVRQAWLCPITRRIVDTTFRGLSPYRRDGVHPPAMPIEMPALPWPWRKDANGQTVTDERVLEWLETDPAVAILRQSSVWGDQHDRAARRPPWLRAAEHSAQQPTELLQRYEALFKAGKINVLSCSTTMEMGVDIGAVEAVMMTNAPPSIANYRQRVGRAGRARQAISLGVTLCKDRPLDRLAFDNPIQFLARNVAPPRVSLDSDVIARRHAHALLLARFLRAHGAELHKLTLESFFALVTERTSIEAPHTAPVQMFFAWLDQGSGDVDLVRDLRTLLSGTPLAPNAELFELAREKIAEIDTDIWLEWQALLDNGAALDQAAARAVKAQLKRLTQSYLLSELAGRGFLPGYGFPTDVTSFVTSTIHDTRDASNGGEEKSRFRPRDFPARQRDIAISEYAPGGSLVIDGVVHRSSGVTLNWKRPLDSSAVAEVQSLRTMSRCRSCGLLASHTQALRRSACDCGSENLELIDYLVPAGFAVDVREQPHDDASEVRVARVRTPWVSARTAAWRSLPDPNVGRLRCDQNGLVFHFNDGLHSHGYAVCLHCGRSEPEDGQAVAGVAIPATMVDHEPLRGAPKAADGKCTGNAADFAIKRNLMLGHEIRTDVCEVQLFDIGNEGSALALAMAMREAVARRLGVESDEMGFAAVQTPSPLGAKWSAVIFDRANGGAGFASKISEDPVSVVLDACGILDCTKAGKCGNAEATMICPACLLAPDTQRMADRTDRRGAFEVLNRAQTRLSLPEEQKLFGTTTFFETLPLARAIDEAMNSTSAALVVFVSGNSEEWDFDAWPLAPVLLRWGGRGRSIRLVMPDAALASADPLVRRRLALWIERVRGTLATSQSQPANILAAVVNGPLARVWGTRDRGASTIGAQWGSTEASPIVTAGLDSESIPNSAPVELEDLLASSAGSVFEIGGELDGSVDGFGSRLRAFLSSRDQALDSLLKQPIERVTYSDRYLFSPLAARLVVELIRGFADANSRVTITTRPEPQPQVRQPREVFHDWQKGQERTDVMLRLFASYGLRAGVRADANTPHNRRLTLENSLGSCTIFFDQGIGAWRTPRRAFPFASGTEVQARELARPFSVSCERAGTFVAIKTS